MDKLGPSLWDIWSSSNQTYEKVHTSYISFLEVFFFFFLTAYKIIFLFLWQPLRRNGCLYSSWIFIHIRATSLKRVTYTQIHCINFKFWGQFHVCPFKSSNFYVYFSKSFNVLSFENTKYIISILLMINNIKSGTYNSLLYWTNVMH